MNFNRNRFNLPISNNKIAGFKNQTQNGTIFEAVPSYAPVKQQPVEEKTAVPVTSGYKSFLARHKRLSEEIDRRNNK